ncbi:IclR family transcriptional regulator [Albibacillus kandeliae]|uniref:IclR family transcriptional regulator n=1 Tax=Albibacillus kandeliae TaxID=2174228 RepID=UPI000D69A268|nr:IclR family transcriptional regulator [Albibacillus kandeliae]
MGTVSKALSLLGLFTQLKPVIGLSELTRMSGLNKATTYRLLSELQEQGFVEQVGTERAYRLGPEVLRLAALREATVPILSVSRGILDRLADATGETAHMSLVRGDNLNALSHTYSPRHATRVMMEDAEVLSFHATGSGLAILAFSDDAFVDRILSQPLRRFTPETEIDPDEIRAALPAIREIGWAESVGGFEADVHSHAAPVFGPEGLPIGALAVAAPVARVTEEQKQVIRTELAACARAMTEAIGGLLPPTFPAACAA